MSRDDCTHRRGSVILGTHQDEDTNPCPICAHEERQRSNVLVLVLVLLAIGLALAVAWGLS